MILTHLVFFGFLSGAGGVAAEPVAPPPAVNTGSAGWSPPHMGRFRLPAEDHYDEDEEIEIALLSAIIIRTLR